MIDRMRRCLRVCGQPSNALPKFEGTVATPVFYVFELKLLEPIFLKC